MAFFSALNATPFTTKIQIPDGYFSLRTSTTLSGLRSKTVRLEALLPVPAISPLPIGTSNTKKNKRALAPDAEQPMFVRYALSPEGLAGPVDGERGWHGHPIAPIRNSWRALGAIRGDAIPRGYRQQLLYLLELYRTPVDQQVPPPHSPPPSLPPGPDDEQPGPKRRIPKSVESTLASKRQRRESTVGGGTKVVAVAKWLDAVEDEDPVHTAPSSPVSPSGKMGLQA